MPNVKVRIGWWQCTGMDEVKIHGYEFNHANPTHPWLSMLPTGVRVHWNNKGESLCGKYKLVTFISPTRDKNPRDLSFTELRLKHAKANVRSLEQHITDLKTWLKD
jgi:hypothetical protein